MPDTSTPEEGMTPDELAFMAELDGDRGWSQASEEAQTPPPPPPGRAGASDPGAVSDTSEGTTADPPAAGT
ncbi:hypothetical protein ACPCSL_32635 [Streptomyces griseoincarnatus]|uniref:hypothetical protein n=1 Tax=unclassified Streptomyces TaxID=2593676 RepID=UPI0013D84450|nr:MULTISPECIES: hypothetical protein [unclassified Streptomyces]MBJ6635876.1 hypothetical protein [Streptomyces sp. I5]MBU5945673.1 hypothetical protein [Streptomyces sp. PAM3C]NEA95789.1 hypothetical protein [Actinospica acidiphila]NUV53505.1 hypothetical protein [Streptomyces coelicolor]